MQERAERFLDQGGGTPLERGDGHRAIRADHAAKFARPLRQRDLRLAEDASGTAEAFGITFAHRLGTAGGKPGTDTVAGRDGQEIGGVFAPGNAGRAKVGEQGLLIDAGLDQRAPTTTAALWLAKPPPPAP